MKLELHAVGEEAMTALGGDIARALQGHGIVYLDGNLGMGKTTLSRGIIRSLGQQGPVKSPTYTLVEPYELGLVSVYHFDLYRLASPEELEFLGVRDYFDGENLCLIEWPEKGRGVLPRPDLTITIDAVGDGRRLTLTGETSHGELACQRIQQMRSEG
ncbi:MAG: tRNA (adenosine(37)-N6)-threonylcarbamoyltransferase complex ATPase subunit type 1 TsaE [Pseudomonadaceae bacterium]